MRIVVIGLGSMGKRRIRLLQQLERELEIVGIDNRKDRVNEAKERYGIKCAHTLVDIEEDFDCAFVCTSPQYHADIIHECLEREWHVFSEINLLTDRYDENIQLAKEKNKVLFLSSTPLYKAEMQYIDKEIKKCKQPLVYQYHVGQYLPDWHPWDNLNEFFIRNKRTNGCREFLAIEFPWLQKTFGNIINVSVKKRNITTLPIDFPDVYMIQIEHEDGNIGNLLVDVVSRQATRHLEIIGEKIYIKWNGTPDSLYKKDIETGELKKIETGEHIQEKGYSNYINEYAYLTEIKEFFKVMNGKQMQYKFEDDLVTLRWIDEIEK